MALQSVLNTTGHRPYPIPDRAWAMTQWWRDLVFAHWPVPLEQIAALLPDSLRADTFEGSAWIAVVPFRMSGIRPRFTPVLPLVSSFAELNVRTYVVPKSGPIRHPGVYFWSLEASSPLAVSFARRFFHLPYMNATMSCESRQGWIGYSSHRTHRGEAPAEFTGRYRPRGPAQRSPLVHWLTERYCLYATDGTGTLYRGDIHHRPWPLMDAEASIETNTMVRALGIDISNRPPLLHFASELEVAIWPLKTVHL